MNIPIFITWLRIIAIPFLLLAFYLPISWNHLLATGIFCLAALTDWLDGYLARNLKQMTRFGAFLDPVADKLMIAFALVLIVGQKNMAILTIPAAVIIGREIVISALREWMAELGRRKNVAVSFLGKVKTVFQMIALITLLIYVPEYPIIIKQIGAFLLYLSAILTLWSMIIYLKIAWPDLTLSQEKE